MSLRTRAKIFQLQLVDSSSFSSHVTFTLSTTCYQNRLSSIVPFNFNRHGNCEYHFVAFPTKFLLHWYHGFVLSRNFLYTTKNVTSKTSNLHQALEPRNLKLQSRQRTSTLTSNPRFRLIGHQVNWRSELRSSNCSSAKAANRSRHQLPAQWRILQYFLSELHSIQSAELSITNSQDKISQPGSMHCVHL